MAPLQRTSHVVYLRLPGMVRARACICCGVAGRCTTPSDVIVACSSSDNATVEMLPHKPAFMLAVLTALLTTAPSTALAWGAAGHAIVATIAQSLLHPAVRSHLCTILPDFTQYSSSFPREGAPHTHCHLAILASWPDTAKWRMPWSGKLHYVNPIDDDPPALCTYGERGWTSQENVLTSMVNYTRQLKETRGADRDVALRFVTHLVGDAHQPLHLTGRARGGNDVFVRFEGRSARLHSVWDSQSECSLAGLL